MNERFTRFSNWVGHWMGMPVAFVTACVIVLVWLLCGPIFGFSDTWQLLINTATTILTNLLVFVVQNTQNRNAAALHLKLDEIIRALPQANTRMAIADLENATDEEIARYKQQFEKLARREGEAEANAS